MAPLLLPAIFSKAILDISNSVGAIRLIQYRLNIVEFLTDTYLTQNYQAHIQHLLCL